MSFCFDDFFDAIAHFSLTIEITFEEIIFSKNPVWQLFLSIFDDFAKQLEMIWIEIRELLDDKTGQIWV